jgi:hypothetical protein
LAFLDEDDLEPADGPGGRRGPDRQRQILVRRLIALGVGVGVVILLVLAVRGCLNARKERGYENYLSDLTSIADSSNQVSANFFERLLNPPDNLDSLQLEAQISADRSTATSDLQRVEGLDTPDELAGAQDDLELAFELRRDALAGIAEDIPTALGQEGRLEATERITADMKALLASDVLYEQARTEIDSVLTEQEIAGKVPQSQFLPDPVDLWLDDLELTSTLSTFAADTAACRDEVHGVELIGTTVAPGNVALTAGTENTVSIKGDDDIELDVEILNGGDVEEKDVIVTFELSGPGAQLEGQTPVASLDAGGTETATLPLGEQPPTGVPLSLEAKVLPVPCESIFDNNSFSYSVTFED